MKSQARRIREVWAQGLTDELAFWDAYLASEGLKWPDEFAYRTDPSALLLESEILQRLGGVWSSTVRILDVGAGPLTSLGKRVPDREIIIVPIDALAVEYSAAIARHNIVPPIQTRFCAAEDIDQAFDPNSFDFAYARNALDHVRSPIRAIRNMLAVTKPNGWVILRHRPNEGAGASYEGLHQWNFEERDGHLTIWNQTKTHDIHRALRWRGIVTSHRDGEWIVCAIRKVTIVHWLQESYKQIRGKPYDELRPFLL